MALRRQPRALHALDVSMMIVATNAIAAFIVLVALLYPDQLRLRAERERAERAEGEVHRLALQRSALEQRAGELDGARDAVRRLEARRRTLNARNGELKQRLAPPASASATLVVTFSAAECSSDKIEFYVHGENVRLADGGDWPPVRRVTQPAPQGVVEYRDRSGAEATLLSDLVVGLAGLTTPSDARLASAARRRAQRQAMWLIGDFAPQSRFGVYAKTEGLRSTCQARVGMLLLERRAAVRAAGAYRWNHVLPASAERRVIHLGHLVWTGTALETIEATREEQLELERTLEKG
jgi:hypothetical protein